MKKPTAIVFGHTGGIGSATKIALIQTGYRIIGVNSDIIDFSKENSNREIGSLITNSQPDVIINCAGIFENGYAVTHTKTMNVNFGSNWSIVRHYMKPQNQNKKVRIIMLGSSSCRGGRKQYPLYSASKAALLNLWESARDAFENTMIQIDLLNPVRTLTAMSSANKSIDPTLEYLKPEQVAEQIIKLVEENQPSRCVDMTFEDAK